MVLFVLCVFAEMLVVALLVGAFVLIVTKFVRSVCCVCVVVLCGLMLCLFCCRILFLLVGMFVLLLFWFNGVRCVCCVCVLVVCCVVCFVCFVDV